MKKQDKFWVNKKVFVTGATGFLGSWLTDELVEKGADVIVLVRDEIPWSNFFLLGLEKKTITVRGSLEDYSVVERILNEYEVDTVFHLGAQAIVGTSNRCPVSTFESNIKGTWNILEALRHVKLAKRIVIASSDKAYGEQKKLPYAEEMPLAGSHPYDVSKSCADMLASSYYKTYGLPIGIVRCGNFFGGGDLNFNRIVPGTIRSVIRGERPVIRSNGKYIRDYIYIRDVVGAYTSVAEHLHRKSVQGEAFNFGNEKPVTVIKLVKLILDITNSKRLKPQILNEASNEIRAQYLSCAKAKKLLGWKPQFSLKEGLLETYEWYKDFLREKNERIKE